MNKLFFASLAAFFFSCLFLLSPILAISILLVCIWSYIFIIKPIFIINISGLFLLFQPLIFNIFYFPMAGVMDEFIIIALVALMIVRKLIYKENFYFPKEWLLICLLIILGFMGNFVYKNVPTSVALGGWLLFMKGFFCFFIFSNLTFNEQNLRLILRYWGWAAAFIAITGILGVVFPNVFSYIGVKPQNKIFGITYAQSFFGHPGPFGAFMAVILCFLIARFLYERRSKRLVFYFIFIFICLIFSFKRTSLTGMVLSFIITYIVLKKIHFRNKKIFKNLFLILLILIVCFSGYFIKMYKNLYQIYFSGIESPRGILLKTGIRIANDNFPLGSGFGTFGSGINRHYYSPLFYKYRLNNIWGLSEDMDSFTNDTFWPHVVAETGWFGLFAYLLIILCFFIKIKKTVGMFDSRLMNIFVLAVFMLLIESIIESTKATFYEISFWCYLYFGCFGIVYSLRNNFVYSKERSNNVTYRCHCCP